MSKSSADFQKELRSVLARAEKLDLVAVEVKAGNLHRRVGEYPGAGHRMPICCDVMFKEMEASDSIVSQPREGKGASVVVRYKLPR